jgi:tetratricopeptide (TPR) repeat protein
MFFLLSSGRAERDHRPMQTRSLYPPHSRARALTCSAFVLLAIVGCASAPPPAVPAATVPQAAEAATPPDAAEGGLPPVNLSGPLLYQIMAAEVAAQRGEAGSAYVTFISLARQTRDPRLAQRAVEVAVGGRALPQALDGARLWRELAPKSIEAAHALGALLIANNQVDAAAPVYAPLIAQDPVGNLVALQRALARAPDRKAAFGLLEQLAGPYLQGDSARSAQLRLVLATGAHAAGLLPRAAEEARAAHALRPDDERTAIAAAQFVSGGPAAGETPGGAAPARAQALALLDGFLKRQPQALDARLTYARLLLADNQYPAATRQFEAALAQDRDNPDALYALGVLSLDAPVPKQAAREYMTRYIDVLARTADAQRDPAPAYLNLARIEEDERNFKEAIVWLKKIDAGPQYVTARAREAIVLGRMKRVDEGRKLLAAVNAGSAEERVALVQAEGQLLRDARRYRDAYNVLAAALAGTPDEPTLLYDTAMAAERLDKLDAVEQHLKRLIELRPDYAHAYNALGYTWVDRNVKLDEAQTLLERAIKLAPNDAAIVDSLGWLHFRRGRLAEARDLLERAFKLRPEGEVGAHLGEVLWTLGQRDAAREIWRRARKIEPDSEALRATLQRLKVRLQ